MTRTFNPESYAKLLAEYQPKIITTEEERKRISDASRQAALRLRTCFNFRPSSQSYSRRRDAVKTFGDIN